MLYNYATIIERTKSEGLSTILTPSDEAFILLLIIVYFEESADTEYAESYEGKHFVLRSGWQEAGIHLWNNLYSKVKADRIENGKRFEIVFRQYYIDELSNATKLNEKRKKKLVLPPAMNDL